MGDRDEFDRIVENLDLDLDFPAEERAEPQHPSRGPAREDEQDTEDEQFYRRVDPPAPRGLRRGTTLAWVGLLGSPLALVVFTLLGQIAPRAVVVGLSLVFIASAIYLIAQLPERGPSHPDDPDDGAIL